MEKTQAYSPFLSNKKNQSHRSYIRSEQILSEEETDLSELVALASCRPAEGCCSLFTRQTSAISNFLLAAHLSPHAVRPRHPSATEADSSDWGRRWPTIGTVLLARPIRTPDVGGWPVSTAFTFGQSSVGGGQPCSIVSTPAGRGCLRGDFWHEEPGWLTAQAHPACVWLKKKKDDMIWNIRLKKNPHFSLVAYSLSSVCVSLLPRECVCVLTVCKCWNQAVYFGRPSLPYACASSPSEKNLEVSKLFLWTAHQSPRRHYTADFEVNIPDFFFFFFGRELVVMVLWLSIICMCSNKNKVTVFRKEGRLI